jgi:hypothetical protein
MGAGRSPAETLIEMARRWLIVLVALALASCTQDEKGGVAEFCPLVTDQSRFDSVFDDFDVTDSQRALQQLGQAHDELSELRDAAPGEIKDDLSVLIDLIERLQKAVEEVDPAKPETARDAVRAIEGDFDRVEEANAELETFRQTRCIATTTTSQQGQS